MNILGDERGVVRYILNELVLIFLSVFLLLAAFLAIFSHNAIAAGVLFLAGAILYPLGVYVKGKFAH